MTKNCLNCGKKIEKKRYASYARMKYCSQECNYDFRELIKLEYDKFRGDICEICGVSESGFSDNYNNALAVHHKDMNPANNNKSNLLTVCKLCHAKLHKKKSKPTCR